MLLAAGVAAGLRLRLLLDDPWAHGYDGWYYVLQVRALQDGTPLFSDASLVFPVLVWLANGTGSAIVGNKLAAAGCAGITAAAGSVLGWRVTDRLSSAALLGGFWAMSALHLSLSAEFLKNAAGVCVLAVLLAVLPRAHTHRRALVLAFGLTLLGPLVHKLTGVMGGVAAVSVGLCHALSGRRIPPGVWMLGAAVLGLSVVAGLLRMDDLQRFWLETQGTMSRWTALWSPRLVSMERVELGLGVLAPVVLLGALFQDMPRRILAAAVLPLSVIALAPGLPFGWDLTSWRLLLMGFVGVGPALALGVAWMGREAPPVVGLGLLGMLLGAMAEVETLQRRSPDYADWARVTPELQARIPEGHAVVAHRGVCGFVWAEVDRRCENFQPPAPHDAWWRIAYGFGTHWFVQHQAENEPAPVEIMPGYTLVWEPIWQRFVAGEGTRFRLTTDPRNPFQPRPDFVYGPGADPAGTSSEPSD